MKATTLLLLVAADKAAHGGARARPNEDYTPPRHVRAVCQEKILDTQHHFVYDNQGDRNGKNIGTDITV